MTAEVLDYARLAELLSRCGSTLPPAELHGGLCGVICAGGRNGAVSWLDTLLDDCSGDAESVSALASRLESLGNQTFAALLGSSFEFRPLLPDDGCTLDSRAEALALWCHGFLAGLVVGGVDLVNAGDSLSAETAELVRDFAEISKAGAGSEDIEDEETGNGSLFELVEYVRVGAQYVFEELVAAAQAEPRTIH